MLHCDISSQKKRKLAPFAQAPSDPNHPRHADGDTGPTSSTSPLPSPNADEDCPSLLFDQHSLDAHAQFARHPSSSPYHPSALNTHAPAPQLPPHTTSSGCVFTTSQGQTPPRFIPPHLHDDVLPSREQQPQDRAGSPSAAFAEVSLSGECVDGNMAVNDTGASGGGDAEQRSAPNITSPSKTLGGRSASPAKRRAEDMEGGSVAPQKSPSSPTREGGLGRKEEEDVSMGDTAPLDDAQDTVASSISTSVEGSDTTSSSSATSLGLEQPPPYAHTVEASSSTNEKVFSTEEIDEKVAKVRELAAAPLRHGDRGVCIAKAWLDRVLSRTSEGLNDKQYANDAREGCIGPLDNSSIVPDGAFDEPVLRDKNSLPFIRLKVGVAVEEDFVILPYETFGSIVGDYGYAAGQKHPIIRYAIDTAEVGASSSNVQYELHPPIITVRKVPQPGSDAQQTKPKTSLGALRVKRQGHEQFGQRSPEDAVRLVTSRSEKFQDFLRRAKDAAAIHMTTKVRVWHLLDPADVIVDTPKTVQSAVPSPPASREASPAKIGNNKLVVPQESFKKMEIGKELEDKDVDDQTNNPKYNGNRTMAVAGFFRDMTMLLEEQLGGPAGGEFQSDSKARVTKLLNTKSTSGASSGRTSPVPSGMMTRGRTRKDGKTRGTVGLSNLGNTCYMNSALQCIRSVEELAVYFLSKRFKKEINNDNPLGYKGAMANAYAGVLRGIYESNGGSSFSPIDFKKSLGKYQPLFSGYGQQDSQEFLSFLVDALHEDLNRIVKKPYIENPDSDDDRVMDPQYILELGETYRTNHAKRNDSVAMDLFSGFYKNKMECPDCNKVSVTFDPYSLVTVQLPIENTMQHDFTYVPLRGKPILHHLDMDKNASIKQVKEVLAKKHPGVDANRLWMIEVYNRKVYRVIDDQSAVAEANIQANDHMFVFELEHVPRNGKKRAYTFNNSVNAMPLEGMASEIAEAFTVPILHRSTEGNSGSGLVMYPIYITVTKEEAKNYDVILKKILVAVANMTSRPILKEFDERSDLSSHVQNGEAPQQPNSTDDAAGISDNSAQSEDGYVNISIEKQDAEMANGTDQAESADSEQLSTYVPPDFMDDQYFLSPALRHHLFDLKYTPSESDSMQFTSGFNSTLKDGNLRIMADRVRKPSRRSSVQSSSSEDSTTSTGSGNRAIPDADEESDSNTKFDDEPDIVLGDVGTDALSSSVVEESEQETIGEDSQIMEPSDPGSTTRAGRRSKKNKRNKGKSGKGRNKHGFMTTSKKGVVQYGVKRPQLGGKRLPGQDDSPYYIQLGEAIVLDWKPEAFDSLFGGNPSDAEEMRGHSIVDENGKGGLIFQDPEQDAKKAKREARKKRGVDLDDCFEVTSRPEVLSEDNAWYCNRCKELRRATKTLEIWTLPDILVVHLKRFGGNRSFRDKVDLKVDYPIEGLDMSDKVGLKEDGKGYIYDLFAVDNHYGGLGGGHYTAIAKNFHDGQWYDYNDAMCSPTNSLHSAAAYLLFYRRRSDKPLGPQYLQDLVENYRNPPAAASDDVEDSSESGEVRLGGPILSGSGSSSVLAGAGHGVKNPLKGLGANGGVGADSPPTTRTMMIGHEDEDLMVDQPVSLGQHTESSWSWATIDTQRDESNRLLDHVGNDDTSSTGAVEDRDSAIGDDDMLDDSSYELSGPHDSPTTGSSRYHQFSTSTDVSHVEDREATDITLSDDNMD